MPQSNSSRDLDAEDHRELALVDHSPRLERVGDDPEPALARAAGLGVDVVLQLADPPRLEAHGVHLVAAVALERVELAQPLVVDEQVHETAQPAPPRPLQPLVVELSCVSDVVVPASP